MRCIKWVFVVCLCVIAGGCMGASTIANTEQAVFLKSHLEEKDKPGKAITLSAVGDILIHDRVYEAAETEDGYDFEPMLKDMKPYMEDATITFANQETMIGGEELGLSGYPAFNSPVEIGEELKDSGVDIVSIANNHSLDRGEEAIQESIKHWKDIDMTYIGAYKDEEDASDIRVLETDEDISIGFLAYTYGTNGISVPDGKDFLLNYIDESQIKKDIAEAQKKADVVVLSLHFGEEYKTMPNEEQENLVQMAADGDVDIVLGHHPHVLQPMEWVEGKNGHETFAIYSLGNFFSGQDELDRQIGGILHLTIREYNDKITVTDPEFMPTFVDIEDDYKMQPMYELSNDVLNKSDKHYKQTKEHMSQWLDDVEFVED
ncbi:MAG TPA: CapA family protein [Pseudogracilibacillus sp.]|nr:CapA family protein [Pseudogracilibacillus sp.]